MGTNCSHFGKMPAVAIISTSTNACTPTVAFSYHFWRLLSTWQWVFLGALLYFATVGIAAHIVCTWRWIFTPRANPTPRVEQDREPPRDLDPWFYYQDGTRKPCSPRWLMHKTPRSSPRSEATSPRPSQAQPRMSTPGNHFPVGLITSEPPPGSTARRRQGQVQGRLFQ